MKPKILEVDGKRYVKNIGSNTYSVQLMYYNLTGEVIELIRINGGYVTLGKSFKNHFQAIEFMLEHMNKKYFS